MATGTCLILSKELYDNRHSSEIEDHKNVLAVDPKNIRLFQETLEEVIDNPEIAKSIGGEARKTAENTEDFKGYVDEMEALYQSVIEEHGKAADVAS